MQELEHNTKNNHRKPIMIQMNIKKREIHRKILLKGRSRVCERERERAVIIYTNNGSQCDPVESDTES